MDPFTDPFGTPDLATTASAPRADLTAQWGSFLQDPESRAALLSFGLQMMQPVALGQNPVGHIAQAIGAGGQSATAYDTENYKRAKEERGLDIKDSEAGSRAETRAERLANAQERLNLTAAAQGNRAAIDQERLGIAKDRLELARQRGKGRGGLTANQLFRANQSQAAAVDRELDSEARSIISQISKEIPGLGTPVPGLEPYRGKTLGEVKELLRSDPKVQERLKGGARAKVAVPAATAADDDEEDDGTPASQYDEGATATNPSTGQKVTFRGGRWVYE